MLLVFALCANVSARSLTAKKTIAADTKITNKTFCNPLNIDYRFSSSGASYREAADPLVVLFKDVYYLFASQSSGYWWSKDFRTWNFVTPTGVDIEKYAPSVWVMGDTMYYTSSSSGDIYKSTDPIGGKWEYISHPHDWNDPWVFADTDGKVYAYHGSSENGTIDCVQLDPKNKFAVIGEEVKCIYSNTKENGFEINGENNDGGLPWTEGASMIKHNGKYYLTYATSGTQYTSYCDGYYVSNSPLGPFTFGANSPATRKSLGFVTGTGHGGLFYDKAGKLWAITCVALANKHWFERRIAVFPAYIDENGQLHTNTTLGDYPMYTPAKDKNSPTLSAPAWNLLSFGKAVSVSSTFGTHSASNAVDENMKTYWSASTGQSGEWMKVDLGKSCTIHAVQTNLYESETTYNSGRKTVFPTRYKVEYSADNSNWTILFDKSASTEERSHDYVELAKPVKARYVRITNTGTAPGNGLYALSDFRIFGKGNGAKAAPVQAVTIKRLADQRCADASWDAVAGADSYIVRYGIAPDKLWNHYQVWKGNSFPIRSLVNGQTYYFRVDACNANGVTKGTQVITVK